ncbi:MAG: glycosyltransferase [Syntrophomonadaceae bacterium]|jgi:glycosyltransferase involved in cell wall biosynthesis
MNLENQDILCIAGVDFEPLWARTQQLMWRMPDSNRIIYVEAPISFLSPFKDPSLWYKWSLWRKGLRKIKDNLYLYSPPLLFPGANRWRWVNRLNQWLMAWVLKKVCSTVNFDQPLLLTYLPNTVDLLGKLKEVLVVYDCVDEHSAFQGFNPRLVKAMEIELLQKSDLVLVTAQPLYNDKARYAQQIHLLRNAADVKHFRTALDESLPVPDDVKDIPSPVLGFIGRIKEWIDLELIHQVAKTRPDWSIIMVGPVEIDADITPFKGLANVHFTGSRSKEELPGYLKKFDVCLNPFRASELSQAVNPLKFYEYLASGKPIVSTPMPEMDMLNGVVEIGAGRDQFIAAVERALDDTPAKIQRRLTLAEKNSWENRVQTLSNLIAQQLGKG